MTTIAGPERFMQYPVPRLRLQLLSENTHRGALFRIIQPDDVADALRPLRSFSEEHFVALHLNSKHEVIGLHEVSHGSLNASLVHPREVFKAACLANSHAILIAHNHPSGSPITPSPEDLDTTQQLLAASRILAIPLIDHVILSPIHDLYSIRENHPEIWDE